jgi:anti-sigma regulatory factor (Ser/Thr protein kinase)
LTDHTAYLAAEEAQRRAFGGKGVGTVSGRDTFAIPECCSLAARLALGALPSAVPCARAYTRVVLAEWGLQCVAEDAEVAVCELTANAVTHGSASAGGRDDGIPAVHLCLAASADRFIVDVWDGSPLPPVMRRDVPGEFESGRGLLLVEALCVTWRWDIVPGWHGKRVRAVLAVR